METKEAPAMTNFISLAERHRKMEKLKGEPCNVVGFELFFTRGMLIASAKIRNFISWLSNYVCFNNIKPLKNKFL